MIHGFSKLLRAIFRGRYIERLIAQMYSNGTQDILCRQNRFIDLTDKLETSGRQITTNRFVRAFPEFEHVYAQHMSDIPFQWLSSDHTFIVSANIGFWHRVWNKQ